MKYSITTLFNMLSVSASIISSIIIFNSNVVLADTFQGSGKADITLGTEKDDVFNSRKGNDANFGDTVVGDGNGKDIIISGEGNDANFGDTVVGDGNGKDIIISGEGNDISAGGKGKDIFMCGSGVDTVKDFNPTEGDIQLDCENLSYVQSLLIALPL
jgi:serralysin